MRKCIIYSHDGSGNHGCEALVRSTISALGLTPEQTVLVSKRPEEDLKYGIDKLCQIVRIHDKKKPSKKTIAFWKAYLELKVRHNYEPLDFLGELTAVGAKPGDVAISIGGDSYCYGFEKEMAFRNRIWKHCGLKTVYWGCSIEPDLLQNPDVVADIATFDLVTARETISYEALKKVNNNTVLVSDSAFSLKRIDLPLPFGFEENQYIGINLSPLAAGLEKDPGITLKNYEKLIDFILQKTALNILLIPHVVWEGNDDRDILKLLSERYLDTERIATVEDCNCMELKGYIARAKFFVGSRTHATIAAYSSYVPTLVLGYSVKARGIARDLFGNEDHYLIPVQELKTEDDLMNAFLWIYQHEQEIIDSLKQVLPEYCSRISNGVNLVGTL